MLKRGSQEMDFDGPPSKSQRLGGNIAMKLLISSKEASVLLGNRGAFSREIGETTGTRLHVSNRGQFFPGTQLQELIIRGDSMEVVVLALTQVLEKILAEEGRVTGGDADLPEGHCRLRMVIPAEAARAVIGRGGDNIRELRQSTGCKVHIDEVAVGQGDCLEQMITLQGDFSGAVQAGLPNISDKVMEFVDQPWFSAWAATSNAGKEAFLAPVGKGNGKSSGKSSGKGMQAIGAQRPLQQKGFGKGPQAVEFNGWGSSGREPYAAPASRRPAPALTPPWQASQPPAFGGLTPRHQAPARHSPPGLDMLSGALRALPPQVAEHRGQTLQFSIPAQHVSFVLGKSGAKTKEITKMTGAKIMIREIEGNDEEKTCIVAGSAVGVAAAYLHLHGAVMAAMESDGFLGGKSKGKGKHPGGEKRHASDISTRDEAAELQEWAEMTGQAGGRAGEDADEEDWFADEGADDIA